MQPLRVLLMSDGRPGHFHLAEGVVAAIARRRPVAVTRREVSKGALLPTRALAAMLGSAGPTMTLKLGYGIRPEELTPADLVVSAGGDTLAANAAAAAALGAVNIYCGTLRHLPVERFSLIVTSYARFGALPRHVVALKPNGMDPDRMAGLRAEAEQSRRAAGMSGPLPHGLLVGGDSGLFSYDAADWEALLAFVRASHCAAGLTWVVSTSRRTPSSVADALTRLAAEPAGPIAELIDFRTAGAGTLPGLFARVGAILCTEDSSSMMSEAVSARLPVVGVAPRRHAFKDEEREYRETLLANRWCASVAMAELTPERYRAALGTLTPLAENHLDRLARALAERLPALF